MGKHTGIATFACITTNYPATLHEISRDNQAHFIEFIRGKKTGKIAIFSPTREITFIAEYLLSAHDKH